MNTDPRTLLTALDDADKNVRHQALMATASVKTPEIADALVRHLGTETECFLREALTWAAVQQGEAVVPGVVELLRSPEPAVRTQAAHVLSKMGDPAHAEHLLPLIGDAEPEVAIKAYRAAANTGDPRVAPALARQLGQGDAHLKDALTAAFGTVGESGIQYLVDALDAPEADVRTHAADILGHLGSPLADPALGKLTALLDDSDAGVRLAAVSALRELDPDVRNDALERAAHSADPIVAAVATAV